MADGQPQAAIPPQPKARQLRACLLCSLIQTPGDFRKNGCPNCEEILQVCPHPTPDTPALTHQRLQMKGSPDRIQSCTSTYFDGIIALIDSETSWVGRWQRICKSPPCDSTGPVDGYSYRRTAGNVRGMYAVRVKGRVPEDVEAELESRGIKYRPRDQTDID